jgi:hypothetical protein
MKGRLRLYLEISDYGGKTNNGKSMKDAPLRQAPALLVNIRLSWKGQ